MEFLVVFVLLGLGLFFGKWAESSHYKSIARREEETAFQPALTMERAPFDRPIADSALAVGSAVVSVDYFKRFICSLRMLFGGEIRAYSSLIDRARREAMLRMKASCSDADLFINTRLETSSISKGAAKTIGAVEVVAYATAIWYAPQAAPHETDS